jgi:hypothetical protein
MKDELPIMVSQRRVYTLFALATLAALALRNQVFTSVMLSINAAVWIMVLLAMSSDIRHLRRMEKTRGGKHEGRVAATQDIQTPNG